MYFKNRYYSTSMGSFVTRDPKEYIDGMSMYLGYFGGQDSDPMGLNPFNHLRDDEEIVEPEIPEVIEKKIPKEYIVDGWNIKDNGGDYSSPKEAVMDFTHTDNWSDENEQKHDDALWNKRKLIIRFTSEGADTASISSLKRLSRMISWGLPADAKIAWDHFISGKGDNGAPKLSSTFLRKTPLYAKASEAIKKMKGNIGNSWSEQHMINKLDQNEKLLMGIWQINYRQKSNVDLKKYRCDARIQFYVDDDYDFTESSWGATWDILNIQVKIYDGVMIKMINQIGAKKFKRKIYWEEDYKNGELTPNGVESYNDEAEKDFKQ